MRAYPRHTVNLSAGCYAALVGAACRGSLVTGPAVERFERAFATFVGTRFAVGVSSGRAALSLAVDALGLRPGDEVIMPAYSFHVVPLVLAAHGIVPVFADVRDDTWNIDVRTVEPLITPRTRAILATHLYGEPCDMDPLLAVAAKNGLKVLEDCAHACGARLGHRRVGSLGDVGLFTFAMAKNMPCFGGGMITTDSAELQRRILDVVRDPGWSRLPSLVREVATTAVSDLATRGPVFSWLVHPLMEAGARRGRNAFDRPAATEHVTPVQVRTQFRTRITALQAAVGLRQLARVDAVNERLATNASFYTHALGSEPCLSVPRPAAGRTSTGLYYRVRVARRSDVRQALLQAGVDTAPDDMSDCSTLGPFAARAHSVPVSASLPASVMEIPSNARLEPNDLARIAAEVARAARAHGAPPPGEPTVRATSA